MKTLEEVKAHLAKVGYRSNEIPVIEGFLFGKGLYEGEEFEVEFIIGDNNFFDFKDWFDSEEKKNSEIDWSEFGFGDFIHVEKDLDVIALGDIYDGKFVGTTGNIVHLVELTNESRPCDEREIETIENKLKENEVAFCCDEVEFVPFDKCKECELEKSRGYLGEQLKSNVKEIRELAESMSDDSPFKEFAMSISKDLGKIVDATLKKEGTDSAYIDKLEVDAKEAIENIIANIHAGTMDEKEKGNVISALKGLVELGNMYE